MKEVIFKECKNYNKFLKSTAVLIMLLVFLCLNVAQAFAADSKDEEPKITAESAILYCDNTDQVVYSKNPTKIEHPYSITKLLTALLIIEKVPLDKKVTVSYAASEEEGSSMGLKPGEVVTVDQLLHGLLILSGNDAAYALAETYPGGKDAFIKAMNDRAKKLGCKNTHFVNPNGLPDDDHYTTASDYLKITRATLSNKKVARIAGALKYNMPATNKNEAWTFKTHTTLRTSNGSGVIAGKTGYNVEDDCTVVLQYRKDNLNLYLILLKDTTKERPKDAAKIFAYAEKKIKRIKYASPKEKVSTAWVRGGVKTTINLYPKKTLYVYEGRKGTAPLKKEIKVNKNIKAPIKKGDVLGEIEIQKDGKKYYSEPLIAHESIEKGWLPSYLYISNFMTCVILIGIVIILVIIGVTVFLWKRLRDERRRFKKQYHLTKGVQRGRHDVKYRGPNKHLKRKKY